MVSCVAVAAFVRVGPVQPPTFSREVSVNLSEQTTIALEWPRLLDALAGHAKSPMGTARCRAIGLATSLQDVHWRQQETTEMGQLQTAGEPLPTFAFPDIREPLARARKGASFEVHELQDCAMVLELLEESSRFVERHHHDAPALV